MKRILRFSMFLSAFLILLSLTGCASTSIQTGELVIGDSSYRLENGDVLDTNLTVIGGNATLDEGSTVNGDVTVIGANMAIDGKVNGSVSVLGGYVYLNDHAQVTGELVTLGGTVHRSAQAKVLGKTTSGKSNGIPLMRVLPVNMTFDPVTGPLMSFFRALALAALAIVLQLFAAPLMGHTGRTILAQPIASGGIGLLTVVIAPVLIIILAITIILIPLSLLGILALGIAFLFGWLCLGLVRGRQLAAWLKLSWSEPVSAGIGTLALSLLSSMLTLIPCLGWLVNALVGLIGLGAAILTRFGTQDYPAVPAALPQGLYTPPPATPAPAVPHATSEGAGTPQEPSSQAPETGAPGTPGGQA
jgi:hypothetical protein